MQPNFVRAVFRAGNHGERGSGRVRRGVQRLHIRYKTRGRFFDDRLQVSHHQREICLLSVVKSRIKKFLNNGLKIINEYH